jgi:hypothetical protein
MSKKETIPPEIKEVVEKIVEDFNKNVLKNGYRYYQIRYKGRFLYLDLSDNGRLGPICLLDVRRQLHLSVNDNYICVSFEE